MNDYSDDEQLELVKKWWSENGKFVIAGIGLGILGLIGWNRYTAAKEQTARDASLVYERLMSAVESNDTDVAIGAQQELVRDYASTPYAAQSRLAVARLHIENGQAESARDVLRELVDSGAPEEILLVARLRLARVLLYLGKAEEASAVLSGVDAGSFQPRFDEVRGDIAASQSDTDVARQAYQAALDNAGSPPLIDQEFVQMKLAGLEAGPGNETVEAADADAATEVSQ